MNHATEVISLLIIDDHALFRDAVSEKLAKEPDMVVAGACGSGAEALRMLRAGLEPVMILLDFDLGAERVIDFLRDAKDAGFDGSVLIVTAGVSGREAIQLIQAGVRGIFHKHNTVETLCDTIRRVSRGELFLEERYLDPMFKSIRGPETGGQPHLTERDKVILRLLFEGLANKEIAAHMNVSEGAVKSSISVLFQKLGVRTRAQVVKVAIEKYGDQL